MRSFFNPESDLWHMIGLFGDLVVLSLLWVLCSLPVLTMGAATAALYDAVVADFRLKKTDYLQRFFVCFRRELKSALLPMLLWGLLLAWLFFLYGIVTVDLSGPTGQMLSAGLLVLLLVPLGMFCWLFPMLSRFTLDFRTLNANALRLALGHLPRTLLIAGLTLAGAEFALRYVLLPLFILPALLALLWSFLMEPIFKRYENAGEEEDAE